MSKLYIVPTPIGNLEDITLRALRILKEADLILAEDTRVTSKLVHHYEIKTPLRAYHQHNEHQIAERIAEEILTHNKTIALVSDAGTPGISDPAFLIVNACLQAGVKVECLPGATAFVPALVKSGCSSDEFVFMGFLPQKKGRQTAFKNIALEPRTIILYESPYRIINLLDGLIANIEPERIVSVSRELTKIYEETITGTATDVKAHFNDKNTKGEFVVVINKKIIQKN
jgi:16S rRNA (cytidine1402-2'-O)-methyltransferase